MGKRLAEMKIGDGLLLESEKEWYIDTLYEFERVLVLRILT
jgi:hypothetical protein